MERVQHALGVGAVLGHGRVDPPGAVAGDDPDRRALLRRQPLEEQVEDLLAVSVVRPDDPLALVVDDDGDVRVALAVRRLVHADRRESVEHRRHRRLQPVGDPARDLAGGPPRHAQEAGHGLLVGDRHQPRALRLEVMHEPAARLRPRHARHHHPVLRARHAWNRSDQFDAEAAEVLVAPTPLAPAVVVPGRLASAARAPERRLPAPHPGHQDRRRAQRRVVQRHILDDHAIDVQQSLEYPLQPRRFLRLYFLVEKQTYRKRPFTPWNSTAHRRTDTHENNTRAIYSK